VDVSPRAALACVLLPADDVCTKAAVFAKRGVAGVGIGFVVVVVSRTKAEVFAKVYCCWVVVVVVGGWG